jgi:hypothetical protein
VSIGYYKISFIKTYYKNSSSASYHKTPFIRYLNSKQTIFTHKITKTKTYEQKRNLVVPAFSHFRADREQPISALLRIRKLTTLSLPELILNFLRLRKTKIKIYPANH